MFRSEFVSWYNLYLNNMEIINVHRNCSGAAQQADDEVCMMVIIRDSSNLAYIS